VPNTRPIPSLGDEQLEELTQLRTRAAQRAGLRENIEERLSIIYTYDQGAIYTIAVHYRIDPWPLWLVRVGLETLLQRGLRRLAAEEEMDAGLVEAIWDTIG
jgi:hypothetical protein